MTGGTRLQRTITLALAQTIAEGIFTAARQHDYRITVAIVGAQAEMILFLRDDATHPHTDELARRKARTARYFRSSTSAFVQRLADKPQDAGLAQIDGVMALGGGVPIVVDGDVIGGIGVSGAPGGDKDEALAQAGLAHAAGLLNS